MTARAMESPTWGAASPAPSASCISSSIRAATAAIVAAFSLVATAAALFVGALVSNENQSLAIGISVGLAFAALGGCMVPFEIFPDWLRTVAHITPHAWAIDAFSEVIQRGGGLGQIGLELAVLVLYGGVLLVAASSTLRRAIIGTIRGAATGAGAGSSPSAARSAPPRCGKRCGGSPRPWRARPQPVASSCRPSWGPALF